MIRQSIDAVTSLVPCSSSEPVQCGPRRPYEALPPVPGHSSGSMEAVSPDSQQNNTIVFTKVNTTGLTSQPSVPTGFSASLKKLGNKTYAKWIKIRNEPNKVKTSGTNRESVLRATLLLKANRSLRVAPARTTMPNPAPRLRSLCGVLKSKPGTLSGGIHLNTVYRAHLPCLYQGLSCGMSSSPLLSLSSYCRTFSPRSTGPSGATAGFHISLSLTITLVASLIARRSSNHRRLQMSISIFVTTHDCGIVLRSKFWP